MSDRFAPDRERSDRGSSERYGREVSSVFAPDRLSSAREKLLAAQRELEQAGSQSQASLKKDLEGFGKDRGRGASADRSFSGRAADKLRQIQRRRAEVDRE